MDIRQLKYFIAIAEEGSLSAASARLHVAQPSLSQHVIKVEEELGVKLIEMDELGQIKELVMSRIADPIIPRPVYLVRNQEQPVTQACRAVERVTVDVVNDLIKRSIWAEGKPHATS